MEIKDNDLKISDQFVNKQYLIDLEKNKLIKDFNLNDFNLCLLYGI